jgi:hypothetical protein
MSVLDPKPDFVEDNAFLYAVLGLLGGSAQILAAADTTHIEAPSAAPEHRPDDDRVLYALLGAIRLASQVSAVAAAWCVDDAPEDPPRDAEAAPPEDLLR